MAAVIRSHETLMAIVNFLTMPLMFASNAMFPVEAMPGLAAKHRPLESCNYAVPSLRGLIKRRIVDGFPAYRVGS